MSIFKSLGYAINAFQQPTWEDAAILFENAFRSFKKDTSPKFTHKAKAFVVDKSQKVCKIIFEKPNVNDSPLGVGGIVTTIGHQSQPLNLLHLTPSHFEGQQDSDNNYLHQPKGG